MSREQVDKILSRWVSRKLLVFLIACTALFTSKLDSNDWVIVATVYIGAQAATDIVEKLFKAKNTVNG